MIEAFMLGMVAGVAIASMAVMAAIASVALSGRSSARHWEQVRRLIHEGGDR